MLHLFFVDPISLELFEGDKKVDTLFESLPHNESKSKKNLKNVTPYPRYRDSCKKNRIENI
jgi:hypothetical protein